MTAARRLILDRAPPDFDPARDIALSPSAFVGREEVWPAWDRHPFEDPLSNPDTQWRDWMRTRILANRLARQLAGELNARHGTSYGPRYWREMTILWLLLLIQSAWLRYLQIHRAIERWGDETLTVPVAAGVREWRFRDDLDFFHNGPKNQDYDLWIGTLLLDDRSPAAWTLEPQRDVGYRPADTGMPPEARKSLPNRAAAALLPRRAVFNLTGAGRAEWLLSLLVPLLPRRPQNLPPLIDETSEAGEIPPFPDDFLTLVQKLIPLTMPETLSGHFAEYDRRAARLPYRRGRLFVSGASKYVPATRFMTAHALENGERVMRYQHGAFYGSAHIMIGHEIEYYDHGFISWGWRADGRTPRPALPLPAPMLSRTRNRHIRQTDDIIFIGTNIELGPYPFKPAPQAGAVLQYRRRKIELIEALAPAARARLRYRPYVNTHSDLDDLEYVLRETGPIPLVTGDLDPPLYRCALAVIDHPGSPMYKAFAANVPTLLVWDRAAWPMHDRGARELDGLARAGIFIEDPTAAARRINDMGDGIGDWWMSGPVQAARQAWCAENARLDRNWLIAWIRGLASTR